MWSELDSVTLGSEQAAHSAARHARRARHGFSIIELLVALTISATLLTATLVALDVMFKRYTVISDAAGSHVVSRMVMHRMLSMIRTGDEFGPYPDDVLDAAQNPVSTDFMEFVSFRDDVNDIVQITRLERRAAGQATLGEETFDLRGPSVLWLVIETNAGGEVTTEERPLLDGVSEANFTLEYDVGPRLRRATIDLTIQPAGSNYSTYDSQSGTWTVYRYDEATHEFQEQKMMSVESVAPSIRLIASTAPRSGL
ncbi:MAG: prepilin-type N-terminal cleavage/methylation domain-containing protein [Phycisphaerales bacterium]